MNKSLIITEPLKSEQVVFSQKIADEALMRGWQIWECTKEDVFLEDGKVCANIISYPDEQTERVELKEFFDVIHFRPHPPIDMGYITALQILKLIEDEVPIHNKPSAVLNLPEKVFPHILGNYSPPTLISQDKKEIIKFAKKHSEIVVKPLYGFGGFDIKKLNADEVENENLEGIYIYQKFMQEVAQGTIRVNMVGGEIYGQLVKIPPQGTIESNFFEDDGLEAIELTQTHKEVCKKISELDIFFCGMDFIGDKLLEVNITCPGTLGIEKICGFKTEQKIWDVIEGKC